MSEANTRGRAASGDGAFATLRHIPELDGVRAISVLFVLLVHASYGRIVGGFLGVDVFFVLSGYLITRLLMRERSVTGTLDLASFYMRRVLRILPPLIVCVALAMAVWPVPGASLQDRLKVISAVMFFYANFYDADVLQCLVHTWSLAIEEQFYLFWPALFLMLRTRARLVALAATVVAVSIAVRTLMVAEGAASATYTFTVTRIDSIAVGALLALCEPELEGGAVVVGSPAPECDRLDRRRAPSRGAALCDEIVHGEHSGRVHDLCHRCRRIHTLVPGTAGIEPGRAGSQSSADELSGAALLWALSAPLSRVPGSRAAAGERRQAELRRRHGLQDWCVADCHGNVLASRRAAGPATEGTISARRGAIGVAGPRA